MTLVNDFIQVRLNSAPQATKSGILLTDRMSDKLITQRIGVVINKGDEATFVNVGDTVMLPKRGGEIVDDTLIISESLIWGKYED